MNNSFVKIGAFAGVLGLVLSIVGLVGGNQPTVSGLYQTNKTQFINGFTAGKSNQFSVSDAGVVSSGGQAVTGNVAVTGDVSATSDFISTKAGLCFNFYATSTATLGKMTASTTATIEGVDGVMMFAYGSCQS